MSQRRISGSIFWGLVFVVLGSLILAHNVGYSVAVWSGVVRYWPVLLIAWGLFKLVDYVRMEPGVTRQPLFTPGDVAAIVFVILTGSLITLAANVVPNFGKLIQLGDLDVWDLTGNSFTYTEQQVMDVPPDSKIEVTNRFGDIDVMSGDVDRITLDVKKTIRAASQVEADKLSPSFVYAITKDGSTYRIGTSFDRRFKASLTIHVPKKSIVSVENRNGRVSIKDLTGNQTITNRFGEIEAHGVIGTLTIHNQNGEVHVDDVSDSVEITSSFAPITVKNIRGGLKIDGRNNAVDVELVENDLDVESAFQNIDIRDPRGSVHVKNRNGEVSIRFLKAPTRDVSVSSEFGGLTLELPAGSSFSADVHSRFGNIDSDFTELNSSNHNADHSLTGQVGTGGPTIKVDSRNGEIRFRKRG